MLDIYTSTILVNITILKSYVHHRFDSLNPSIAELDLTKTNNFKLWKNKDKTFNKIIANATAFSISIGHFPVKASVKVFARQMIRAIVNEYQKTIRVGERKWTFDYTVGTCSSRLPRLICVIDICISFLLRVYFVNLNDEAYLHRPGLAVMYQPR